MNFVFVRNWASVLHTLGVNSPSKANLSSMTSVLPLDMFTPHDIFCLLAGITESYGLFSLFVASLTLVEIVSTVIDCDSDLSNPLPLY